MSASQPPSCNTTIAEPMAKLAISEVGPATEQTTSAKTGRGPRTPLNLDRLKNDYLNNFTFEDFREHIGVLSEVC